METTRGRGRGEEWRLQGVEVEVRSGDYKR